MTAPVRPQVSAEAAGAIGALARLYWRHGDVPRALALGLAAMQAGPATPELALVVAASFLGTDDPEQALAALSRFEGPGRLATEPTRPQMAAAALLRAKALHRRGEAEAAREALAEAARLGRPDDAQRREEPTA